MEQRLAIGIDLGGTQVRAALVDITGKIHARAATATDVAGGPVQIVAQIKRLVDEICPIGHLAHVAGVGVSAPGPLDSDLGLILEIPTLAGWHNVPLRSILAEKLGLPIILENDGIAAANGEWKFGAAKGLQNFVYVTVSTGIGGGVVVDNHLLHGRRGMVGHVGHMVIDPLGPYCSCGARGCFEAIASGTALGHAGRKAVAGFPASILAELPVDKITARTIVDAARQDDSLSLELLEREAKYLGTGFSNLIHLYSPQRLIMGGGVALAFDLLQPVIVATVQTQIMPPFRGVDIVPALLCDNAGLVGAATLVWEREP